MKVTGFSLAVVAVSFALLLLLLLAIPLAANTLNAPAIAGITWGHLLVILIHVLPVIAAWIYTLKGGEPS